MTLEEAMNQTAKTNGYHDWADLYLTNGKSFVEGKLKVAAELYARSKWDEAILKDRKLLRSTSCLLVPHLPAKPPFNP